MLGDRDGSDPDGLSVGGPLNAAPGSPSSPARVSLAEQWKAEKESAWLYRSVANAETEHAIRRLFEQLAQTAESQAILIEEKPGVSARSKPP